MSLVANATADVILVMLSSPMWFCSIFATLMHGDEALALRFPDLEASVGHAQRREQMIAQVSVEPLAAHSLDRLADEINIGAVFPAGAGVRHERRFERIVLAGGDGGRTGLLQILHHVAVPHVVGEAGGMGHEMAQRDWIPGRP